MISARTRRTRSTSTCASAMRSAAARRASLASGPAICPTNAVTSAASVASASTGRLRPWRSALRADAALPASVRGPVLRDALARLAARTAALVMRGRRARPRQDRRPLSFAHVLVGEPASTSPEHAPAPAAAA
jgi:hypothetical protein